MTRTGPSIAGYKLRIACAIPRRPGGTQPASIPESIRFHGPNPSSWPARAIAGCSIAGQSRSHDLSSPGVLRCGVLYRLKFIDVTTTPRDCLDAVHVSSNVTPCRAAEIVHRASAGCLLAGGADLMFLIGSHRHPWLRLTFSRTTSFLPSFFFSLSLSLSL